MFAVIPANAGHQFVDRSDIDGKDWGIGDLTLNGQWQDLDLTGKIGVGAVLVLLSIANLRSTSAMSYIHFRKKGNTNNFNVDAYNIPLANEYFITSFLVMPNANGVIQYKGSSAFNSMDMSVCGWFV